MVIARIGTEITMKRYHEAPPWIELRPESTNPEHKTIRVDESDDWQIVGVIVGAVIGMEDDQSDDGPG